MTRAPAVLNAPVSIALLPNTLYQNRSCPACCAGRSGRSSRLGEAKGVGQDITESLRLLKDTVALTFLKLFQKANGRQ